jgi:DNA-binding LytR/AlgR family response regulator
MKILIIEDEKLAAERLQKMLSELPITIEVVGIVRSIDKGKTWLKENSLPDLILSDIQLLDGLSFEIFKANPVSCPVVFTTAFDQYALQAFEVNGLDYILKPIQSEKLQLALEKAQKSTKPTLISTEDLDTLADMIENRKKKYKSRFLVKLGQKIKSIPVEQIAYFFTDNKLTFLMTSNKEKFPLDNSLDELETLLDPELFFRANRKYMITLDAVKEIHPYFKGRILIELLPEVEEDIVVSSEKTPSMKAWLDK